MKAVFCHTMKCLLIIFSGFFFFSGSLQAQRRSFADYDFRQADSVADLYPNHSLADLKHLADKLTKPLSTDEEKFRAIYRWVCNNIENDYGLYVKNKRKREKLKDDSEALHQWNKKFAPQVFKKLLREQRTVCTGYAYLLRELSYHAGLNCKIIDGYGRTAHANIGGPGMANHSWNAVLLNNQWYLCDATWSSGVVDPQQANFIKQFSEGYFLADPALFVRNHYPLDTSWILQNDKPTLQEFLNGPLIYKGALNHQVSPLYPETFEVTATKGERLTFHFHLMKDQQIEKAALQIIRGSYTKSVYPEVQQDSNVGYFIDHTFKRKGNYVVHMLLDGDPVFTYSVKVSN